jgi:hypothetical protein
MHSGEPAVTVFDWKTQKVAVMYKKPGFSIYGDVFAGETAGGEIGISGCRTRNTRAELIFPPLHLCHLGAGIFT